MMEEKYPNQDERKKGVKGPDADINNIRAKDQIFMNTTEEQARNQMVVIEDPAGSGAIVVNYEQAFAIIQEGDERDQIAALTLSLDNVWKHNDDFLSLYSPQVTFDNGDIQPFGFVLANIGSYIKEEKIVDVQDDEKVDGICPQFHCGTLIKAAGFEASANGVEQSGVDYLHTVTVDKTEYVAAYQLPEAPAQGSYVKATGHGTDLLKPLEDWKSSSLEASTDAQSWVSGESERLKKFMDDMNKLRAEREKIIEEEKLNAEARKVEYKKAVDELNSSTSNKEAYEKHEEAQIAMDNYFATLRTIAGAEMDLATATKYETEAAEAKNEINVSLGAFVDLANTYAAEAQDTIDLIKKISQSTLCKKDEGPEDPGAA